MDHNKFIINQNTLIINSLDRDWFNDTNSSPYNFKVELSGSNNANIAVINEYYKNISSMAVPTIIIPNTIQDLNYHSNTHIRPTNYPYLLVNIENIVKSSRGTNKDLDTSIGMFIPSDLVSETSNNIKNVEYKNVSKQVKDFEPNPLASLTDLKITIKDSRGISVPTNDVVGITGIYVSNDPLLNNNTDLLIISTTEYFTYNEFLAGDLIFIKNYVYHNMSYSESYQFVDFINRTNGHIIVSTAKSDSATELYNEIKILVPKTYSRSTGQLTADAWFTSLMTKSLTDSLTSNFKGKIINTNKQSHLVIKLGLKKPIYQV